MNFFKNFKLKVNEWLERMAKENEKIYGNGRLDCCNMNKKYNYNNYKDKSSNHQ